MERAIMLGANVSHAMRWRRQAGIPIDDPIAGLIAVKAIQQYMEAARRQQFRMVESRAAEAHAQARHVTDDPTAFNDVWSASAQYDAELHFYASAWALIGRMIKRMKRRSGFKAFGTAHKTWGPLFKHYADLRDHLEHFEQRLPGMDRGDAYLRRPDPRNPPDTKSYGWDSEGPGTIRIGEQTWDVSLASLLQLESLVQELFRNLEQEATAIIASAQAQPSTAECASE
ncbi:MAG: hypothetical protein M3R02_11935 [Chloroflexota bacterium]|nr:hypothetical protein [Chloroflexota bacterium]